MNIFYICGMETIHMYFKGAIDGLTVLVQINPESLKGLELVIDEDGRVVKTDRELDEDVYDDLAEDGFVESSALEFNLYLKGVKQFNPNKTK